MADKNVCPTTLAESPIYKFVPVWGVVLPLCCSALGTDYQAPQAALRITFVSENSLTDNIYNNVSLLFLGFASMYARYF